MKIFICRDGDTSQQLQAWAALPENPELILSTYMMEHNK